MIAVADRVSEQDIEDRVKTASEEGFSEVYAEPGAVTTTQAWTDVLAASVAEQQAEEANGCPSGIPGEEQFEKDRATWNTTELPKDAPKQ